MTPLTVLDILIKVSFTVFICVVTTLVAGSAMLAWNWIFEKRCLCKMIELPGGSPVVIGGFRHSRNACWPNRETVIPDQPYDYERWGL